MPATLELSAWCCGLFRVAGEVWEVPGCSEGRSSAGCRSSRRSAGRPIRRHRPAHSTVDDDSPHKRGDPTEDDHQDDRNQPDDQPDRERPSSVSGCSASRTAADTGRRRTAGFRRPAADFRRTAGLRTRRRCPVGRRWQRRRRVDAFAMAGLVGAQLHCPVRRGRLLQLPDPFLGVFRGGHAQILAHAADAWASKHPRQVLSFPCRVSRKS